LYRHVKPNKPPKEGPLSFVLFESPFLLVSTVSRGHFSLIFTGKRSDDEIRKVKKICA
jgi:hypothetical protein